MCGTHGDQPVLVQLERLVKPLHALLELLLIQQQLSAYASSALVWADSKNALVIIRLASIGELLENPPERGHARSHAALLVLGDRFLNVSEDEGSVERRGLLVIGDGFVEFLRDEVDFERCQRCEWEREDDSCSPCPRW